MNMNGKSRIINLNEESGYESLSYVEGPVEIIGNPNGVHTISPIIKASYNKHDNQEIVKKLIDMGANVNTQTSLGSTALNEAAFGHKRKIIEVLLEHGADVHHTTRSGNTALHSAAKSLERVRGSPKYENDLSVIKALLRMKSNVNARNNAGNTPFLEAVKGFHLDIVRELLEAGSDVNARNVCGQTCFHLLFNHKGKTDIMIELIKAGAPLQAVDKYGETPFEILLGIGRVNKKQMEIIKELIRTALLVDDETKENYYIPFRKPVRKYVREINKFVDKCGSEVQQMRTIQLSRRMTLCDFALCGSENSGEIVDSVYEIMMNNTFKMYDDYIVAHFEKAYLILKILKKGIYTTDYTYDVLLTEDAVYDICNFLSKSDLLGFLRAFTNYRPPCKKPRK